MKHIGNLLLVIGVIFGALAAATAYLVPLSAPDDAFKLSENGEPRYVTLSSPAGATEATGEEIEELRARFEAGEISATELLKKKEALTPIAEKGEEVTPELLAELRDANVQFIRVAEFGFMRWPHWWVFLGSAALLLVGSMMLRAASKAEVEKAGISPRTGAGAAVAPEESLASIRDAIDGLRRDLPGMPDSEQRLEAVMERLGDAQAVHVVSFIEARPALVSRLGLGGYAELMDRFAALERQINRSWSAAADGVEEESLDCLERAAALLEETERVMPS